MHPLSAHPCYATGHSAQYRQQGTFSCRRVSTEDGASRPVRRTMTFGMGSALRLPDAKTGFTAARTAFRPAMGPWLAITPSSAIMTIREGWRRLLTPVQDFCDAETVVLQMDHLVP